MNQSGIPEDPYISVTQLARVINQPYHQRPVGGQKIG